MLNEATFARRTLRAYQVYADLAEHEAVPEFRAILDELAETSKEQFDFWARKSGVRGDTANISKLEILFFRVMRRIFGLPRTAAFIVGRKERRIATYRKYCATCTVSGDVQAIDAFVSRLAVITERISEVARKRAP